MVRLPLLGRIRVANSLCLDHRGRAGQDSNRDARNRPGDRSTPSSGSTVEPIPDVAEGRIARGDSLDHRYINIGFGVFDGPTLRRQEALDSEKGATLVAVGKRVILREVFDEGSGLLDQRWVGIVVAEARARNR